MTAEQLRNSILQEIYNPKDGWTYKDLKDVVADSCPISYGIVQQGNHVNGGIPVVRPVDLHTKYVRNINLKCTSSDISNSYKRTILNGNEILLCVRGTTGIVALATEELRGCNVNRGIVPLYFDDTVDRLFIYYQLQSPTIQDFIAENTMGSALRQINIKDLRMLKILLPPLAEQKRIVAKLEELLPIVEQYGKAQKELDELNAALPARLRQSILQEAFCGKLTGADMSDWEDGKLGDLVDILYGFPFQANMFNPEGHGKPIIRIRDIVPSKTKTYSTETCDEKYHITNGDMLVGMDGNFHVRFWYGGDAYLNQRVCRITAHSDKLLQKYLYYYLPVYLEELEQNVSKTTVGHLSDKHLKNMSIPLPPLAEQQRIVAKIEELFAEIDKLSK